MCEHKYRVLPRENFSNLENLKFSRLMFRIIYDKLENSSQSIISKTPAILSH